MLRELKLGCIHLFLMLELYYWSVKVLGRVYPVCYNSDIKFTGAREHIL